MIVVDASVWVRALVDDSGPGAAARSVLTDHPHWYAPAHAPHEVLRTLRRYETAGELTSSQVSRLADAAITAEVRYFGPERWLLEASWQLRHNVSAYDAPYVVIARVFQLPLVTFDTRLGVAARLQGVQVIIPGTELDSA